MNFLLDTQLVLWLYSLPSHISADTWRLLLYPGNSLHYSPVSFLEIEIKNAKGREDFAVDCPALLSALHASGVSELVVTALHTMQLGSLPPLHKDPFDRLLLAQAVAEGFTLLTTDWVLSRYPSNVLNVG